jgi:hypothetical protein
MTQRVPTDMAGERSHLCEEPRPLLPFTWPGAFILDESIATPGTVSANGTPSLSPLLKFTAKLRPRIPGGTLRTVP